MTKIDVPGAPVKPPSDPALKTLERTSREFEALLFREMVKSMVRSSTEGGFFGKEAGADTWEQMFESGLSEFLAAGGNLGIAREIYERYASRVSSPGAQGAAGTADP